MTVPRRHWRAALELGLAPLASYAAYRAGMAGGWFRWQTPVGTWDSWPLQRLLMPGVPADPAEYMELRNGRPLPRFFFESSSRHPRLPWADARRSADEVLRGIFPFGGGHTMRLGFPPESWSVDVEGKSVAAASTDRHWTQCDLRSLGADARLAWEPSRFGWTFPLARAYQGTGDQRYADGFWRLWVGWRDQNPPNSGLQWTSAQEVALRMLALVFAFHAFAPAWRRRPERAADLARAILVHARRIPPTIAYARAQGNNHLLSEAAGVYTAGLLFPEARGASRWRTLGRSLFLEGLRRQIFPDGGYVQHSANYHRFALQLGFWISRLAELNDDPLPAQAIDDLAWSTLALAEWVDAGTGSAARFGPDDGTNALPMGGTIADYRPTLQAASRAFLGRPLFGAGPWDAASAWLGWEPRQGPRSARKVAPTSAEGPAAALPFAGVHRLAGRRTWGLLRAAHFTTRPGHSDQLHVDLWWRGVNVALDPGSYLYRAPAPWEGGLAEAALHNTVTVDGGEPMERAGPFLWLKWAQAAGVGRWASGEGSIDVVTAEHDGYRPVVHRRTVARMGESEWWVVDDLRGPGSHRLTLGWNTPNVRWSTRGKQVTFHLGAGGVRLSIDGGDVAVYRAGELVAGAAAPGAWPAWGWRSPGYGRVEPCLRVVASVEVNLPARFVSRWSLGRERGERARVRLAPTGKGPSAIASVRLGRTTLEIGES